MIKVNTSGNHRLQAGFSLIELMVVVVVLAVLAGIAVPAMQDQIASSRVTATTNDLLGALANARSEAVRRGSPVTIAATDGDWKKGWNSTVTVAGNNVTLTSGAQVASDVLLTNTVTSITFNTDGSTTNTGNIQISSSTSSKTRTLQILGSGKSFISN